MDMENKVRTFESGATRDSEEGKLDYEGFLSPAVLRRYAEYMNRHRKQPDGQLRASDNWQKGIPRDVYIKSMFRHFMEVWALHRDDNKSIYLTEETVCALLFNVMGYLHEQIKAHADVVQEPSAPEWERVPSRGDFTAYGPPCDCPDCSPPPTPISYDTLDPVRQAGVGRVCDSGDTGPTGKEGWILPRFKRTEELLKQDTFSESRKEGK